MNSRHGWIIGNFMENKYGAQYHLTSEESRWVFNPFAFPTLLRNTTLKRNLRIMVDPRTWMDKLHLTIEKLEIRLALLWSSKGSSQGTICWTRKPPPIPHLLINNSIYYNPWQFVYFKHMSFWCPFLDPHPTAHHSNSSVHLREVTELGPLSLILTFCTERVLPQTTIGRTRRRRSSFPFQRISSERMKSSQA
jgi:hypothetical protein